MSVIADYTGNVINADGFTSSGATTINGVVTFGANPTFAVGKTLNLDSGTVILSSQAGALPPSAGVITTESLSTAAAASQDLVITMTGLVAAGDLAFVQWAGGTNTAGTPLFKAVCTTNTVTITVYNKHASAAFSGTFILNLWVVKA